uniref:Uncharacterized protein n=1 Tax=Oryzias latipes TaxID=8090 RepID=A0A3P9MQ27_ORYLA
MCMCVCTASDIVCSVCVSQVTVQFILVCVCSLCNLCVLVHVFLFVASLNACSHKLLLQVPAYAGAAARRSAGTEFFQLEPETSGTCFTEHACKKNCIKHTTRGT